MGLDMTLLMSKNVTELTSLIHVPTEEVEKVWGLVEDDIAQALRRSGHYTADEIFDDLLTSQCDLWLADHARDGILGIMVTYIVQLPLKKICRIFLCVGSERQRWIHHLSSVEDWAKAKGCKTVVAVVRPGWERIMDDYKKTHVTMEKPL
jgi:hypothetical protein